MNNFTNFEAGKTLQALSMKIQTFTFLIILLGFAFISRAQDSIPADFCISAEEHKLYLLINDYRKAMNLPEISLSKSLSFVAKTHAKDLATNKPDTNTCNFHSWSDKGNWTACCFEKEIKDKSCMESKPGELTNYPGHAHEIVYWENKEANAERAFDQWRETSAARSLITNFKEWEDHEWRAVGLGIYKGFAIAWFGEDTDPEIETIVCGSNKVIKASTEDKTQSQVSDIISTATGRFYLIYGSFNELADAKKQLRIYQSEGFKKARIVSKDNKFRISLSDYSSMEQASSAKKELPSKFKGAWVLTF